MPYCPRCGTALSSHEVALGYHDVVDPSIYVRFPVAHPRGPLQDGDALLVWTTTPWTLVSNAAVAMDPDLTYVRARQDGAGLRARGGAGRAVLGEGAEVLDRFAGREIEGTALRAAVPVHRRGRVRRPGPHGPGRGLRLGRRRHRPRAHRDRLRRGRLPPRRAVRPERRQPGAAGRHLRRAHRPLRRALREGRRPGPDRGPRARAACSTAPRSTSTPIRTAGAATRRCSTTRRRAGTSARPRGATSCSPPTSRSTGTRSTSSTGASASGSRTTWTGRCRASATGARRCRCGAASDGHDRCIGSLAELRELAGDLPRTTCTARTSTTVVFPCPECGGEMRAFRR